VATLKRSVDIEIRAQPAIAFAIVTSEVAQTVGARDAIEEHHPLTEGPVRPGFRWRQTLVHERHRCSMDWTVRHADQPSRFEQSYEHHCTVTDRRSTGGEAWTFVQRADTTLVTLTTWRERSLLTTPIRILLAGGLAPGEHTSLRQRLSYVQFQAERQERAQSAAPSRDRPRPAPLWSEERPDP
jgi:hypothetical protein